MEKVKQTMLLERNHLSKKFYRKWINHRFTMVDFYFGRLKTKTLFVNPRYYKFEQKCFILPHTF